jgi:16S rRNA (guanine966-N2)-methyltransferase
MRITGGELGGRRLKAPAGSRVRPTQDRVRGALFSMLAAAVPGARVLDLFAGTGAVGFEALSRGAADVVWIEADRRQCAALKAALAALGPGRPGRVACDDCLRWLRRPPDAAFDLVFADPPYEWAAAHGFAGIAARLRDGGWLRPGGLFVAEQPATVPAAAWDGWELLRDRVYGQTRLAVYRMGALCKTEPCTPEPSTPSPSDTST